MTAIDVAIDLPHKKRFRKDLLAWYARSKRDLPWRRTREPYFVWISEIMLQQTRVTAAIPYYERFLARFPDCETLADSPEADLLAHWAGLGYYCRARNLQKAAKLITQNSGFPSTYQRIRDLPGVGDYTAAAIASISFNLPHAVVDGNVLRVLSRVANDATDIASSLGKKRFAALADDLLDRDRPGDYNQALMELGATVCLPKNPQCLVCPVAELCIARAHGRQQELPVKLRAQKSVEEHRTVYWIEEAGRILAWQRPADSRLMPGFWELPEAQHLPGVRPLTKLGAFKHGITFHNYRFTVEKASPPSDTANCCWIEQNALSSLPLSTIFRKAYRIVAKTGSIAAAAGTTP